MTAPYLAPSLVALRNSVNAAFPHRDKSSDGWIGNAAHAATQSEHNPDSKGCVHALDVDVDDNDAGRDLRMELLAATLRHPAVWYVITNGVIYSRTHGWTPRRYTGSNGHFKHVHISVLLTPAAEGDTSLQLRGLTPVVPPLPTEADMPLTDADVEKIVDHLLDRKLGPSTVADCLSRARSLALRFGEGGDLNTQLDRIEAKHV